MKKEFVLKYCKMLELGDFVLSGDVGFFYKNCLGRKFNLLVQHGLWQYISSYTKAWIHYIYFQIFCLFFTTMLYKLLKIEDQELSPRKCFINILKLYYTSVHNRVLVYASTLALITRLSNFGNVKTRISIFLLVEGILFIVKTFKGKIFISNICHIPLRIK